jgi:hypothetical protein
LHKARLWSIRRAAARAAQGAGVRPGRPDAEGVLNLAPRQLEIVHLVGRGYSPGRAARQLRVSLFTVKTHIRNIGEELRALYPEYRPRERIIVFYREFLLKGDVPPDVIDILAAALRMVAEDRGPQV